ncbi:unnamed protein product [Echinostoma caproni]|uniref:Cyclophil_like2 domain-containing protein n=1 Tax=Echinostoma caproni TaxID=27848 RepID=A0A183AXH0_9TREM|nr:unnamed protein product [Echinostoma caproni]
MMEFAIVRRALLLLISAWDIYGQISKPNQQAQAQLLTIELDGVAQAVIKAIKKGNTSLQDYGKSFSAAPLDGAYFVPLWELNAMYKLYATLGLPSRKGNLSTTINPKFMIGEVIAIYVSAQRDILIFR